jgi:DNA-binding MarR family transcriptional regulator
MPRNDPVQDAVSRLVDEICLNRPFTGLAEASFLSLVWTWQMLEEVGRSFFPRFGITGAQFNVLMILADFHGRAFRQAELAEILVVNRASIGSVLERMERDGWIERTPDPADKRATLVTLAPAGKAKLDEVRAPYYRLLGEIFAQEDERDLRAVILFCDRLRSGIARLEPQAAVAARRRRK